MNPLVGRLRPLLAALVSSVWTFQLLLAGSGVLCLVPHGGARPAMRAPTTAAAMTASPASTDGAMRDGAMPDVPCGEQQIPVQCLPMAACASGAVVTAPVPGPGALGAFARIFAPAVLIPPSPTSLPELPPPRA